MACLIHVKPIGLVYPVHYTLVQLALATSLCSNMSNGQNVVPGGRRLGAPETIALNTVKNVLCCFLFHCSYHFTSQHHILYTHTCAKLSFTLHTCSFLSVDRHLVCLQNLCELFLIFAFFLFNKIVWLYNTVDVNKRLEREAS